MFQVVRAAPHHHAAVSDLLERVFIGEGYAPASSRERLRQVERIASIGDLLVAQDAQGQAVGAVVYLSQLSSMAEVARPREGEIRLLAVLPPLRTQGIGKFLVQACIERALQQGHQAIVLSTQPSMTAAQALYQRLGFVRVQARDWVHASGSSRLVYSKSVA